MEHISTESSVEAELVKVSEVDSVVSVEGHPAWHVLSNVTVRLTSEISIECFTIRNLLGLTEGQTFASVLSDTEDVPLRIGDLKIGWTEFEVVEQKVALRLTRLV